MDKFVCPACLKPIHGNQPWVKPIPLERDGLRAEGERFHASCLIRFRRLDQPIAASSIVWLAEWKRITASRVKYLHAMAVKIAACDVLATHLSDQENVRIVRHGVTEWTRDVYHPNKRVFFCDYYVVKVLPLKIAAGSKMGLQIAKEAEKTQKG